MQTSIAHIKAGYRNSVSDELVVEKPGRTLGRQKKADTTNTWCRGSSKANLPSFWKIALEIYVRLGPSVFLYHEDVDFQISGEFFEFENSEICSYIESSYFNETLLFAIYNTSAGNRQ